MSPDSLCPDAPTPQDSPRKTHLLLSSARRRPDYDTTHDGCRGCNGETKPGFVHSPWDFGFPGGGSDRLCPFDGSCIKNTLYIGTHRAEALATDKGQSGLGVVAETTPAHPHLLQLEAGCSVRSHLLQRGGLPLEVWPLPVTMMGSGNRDRVEEQAGGGGGGQQERARGGGTRDKHAALLSMYSIKQHPSGDRCHPRPHILPPSFTPEGEAVGFSFFGKRVRSRGNRC